MSKNTLLKNTVLLYVLTLSSYVFMFITIPYQTRILGPEIFGLIGVVTAAMMVVSLILDFGFMLYATGEVSRNRDSRPHVRTLYSSVIHIKLLLSLLCLAVLYILSVYVPFVADHFWLLLVYLLACVAQGLLPDFLYRGMENMLPITTRSVLARSVFVVLIFAFLKEPEQYMLIPAFLLIANCLALVFAWMDIYKRFDIRLTRVQYRAVFRVFASSSQFFLSRIATTVYGASSTIIVNLIAPGTAVGHFASVDKLVTAAKSGVSPLADSIYPHMIATKNYKLLKKVLIGASAVSIALCIFAFFNATFVCVVLFGEEYAGAAPILQALLPIIALTPAQYLLGFPALAPLKLVKHANYSIFLSAACYAIIVGAMFASSNLTPVKIALAMTISELASVAYRVAVLMLAKYRWGVTSI